MTVKLSTETIGQIAEIRDEPLVRQDIDRTFELPTGLYVATVGAYLAFLGVMAAGFQSRDMILPMAIFVIYIAMAFGVPALWARMRPDTAARALGWDRFMQQGVDTWAGRIAAKDAALQVLILPVLILFWGVAVVMIAALV
jgi:hypothetical protein